MSDLSPLDRWKELAAVENARARKVWKGTAVHMVPEEGGGIHRIAAWSIAERVKPYLGKGYTAEEVAVRVGCHLNSVRNAIRKNGWTL